MNDRRTWLKRAGFAIAGIGLAPLEALAITPAASDKPILLRSNENPYGASPLARKAMSDHVAVSNRYGWALSGELLTALGRLHGLTDEHILLGAGSTEIIDATVQLAARQPGNFLLPTQTYSYWTGAAVAQGLTKREVPVKSNKQHDLNGILKAIDEHTRLVYICNPDNPSGTVCADDELRSFVREASKRTLVLVDEAYLGYSDASSLSDMVNEHQNLIVSKTFSKIYGMAGARVGYAIAHPDTIGKLAALQGSPHASVSVVTVAGALAAIKDAGYVEDCKKKNEQVRRYTIDKLTTMGILCTPSHTNFIYFSLSGYKDDFFNRLKNNDIEGTRIYDDNGKWTRITVGTMAEMEMFVKAIG